MRISDWSSDVCSSDLLAASAVAVFSPRLVPAVFVFVRQLSRSTRSTLCPAMHATKDLFLDCHGVPQNTTFPFKRQGRECIQQLFTHVSALCVRQRSPELQVLIHLYCTPRSEERRIGKECVRQCRSRRSPYH